MAHSQYAQNVIDGGPEIIGQELDRLQRKISRAQLLVDHGSKLSTVLFLDEGEWDRYDSYSAYRQELDDFVDSLRRP